jgi:hypothetical protein
MKRGVILTMALVLWCGFASGRLTAQAAAGPQAQNVHAVDLTTFLGTLQKQDQGLTGNQALPPAPENRIISCQYQRCPTGQTCWFCHSNWVCIFNYPDPDQVPPGCTGGGPL